MENRILIIGDSLLGEHGEVASRCSEMLLCTLPNRPIQFSLEAPTLLSIPQLLARASANIIGKRPGRIVLALGFDELRRARGDGAKVMACYGALVEELLKKTQTPLNLVTIPKDLLIQDEEQIDLLNGAIRSFKEKDPGRITIFDFEQKSESFKEKQAERGKFARSLYSEQGKPTSLCETLLSMFLQDCILGELKNNKELK